jgi:hypothetical protein
MLEDITRKRDRFVDELGRMQEHFNNILEKSPLLDGLNLNNDNDASEILERLTSSKDTTEWWAFLVGFFSSVVEEAIEDNDSERAAWAMACAERCRSMVIFKQQLEEVVWMGHSAKRIVDVLRVWDTNKSNSDEEFWQETFNVNSYVISQVFAVPVLFMQDKAYVGGMLVNRNQARFVDYLFSSEFSQEAILVEIKTPIANLLGKKYRGVYTPSTELNGAIVQVLDYKATLIRNVEQVGKGFSQEVSAFNPRCVVIIGNSQQQIDSAAKRSSFELFRRNLKDVEVVTYDELFRKVEVLASLFNLIKKEASR